MQQKTKNPYSLAAFEERWYSRPIPTVAGGDSVIKVGREKSPDISWRQAAVLIGLVEKNGEARIILTERAKGMRDHSGQIAFPGGKVDATDQTIEKAALREAHEEIGL